MSRLQSILLVLAAATTAVHGASVPQADVISAKAAPVARDCVRAQNCKCSATLERVGPATKEHPWATLTAETTSVVSGFDYVTGSYEWFYYQVKGQDVFSCEMFLDFPCGNCPPITSQTAACDVYKVNKVTCVDST